MPKFTPKPYQPGAIQHILDHPKSMLHGKIGSGKTIIALTAIRELIFTCQVSRVLVVAPLNVIHDVFENEFKKWDHLQGISFKSLHGRHKHMWLSQDHIVHMVNYEGLAWLKGRKERPHYDLVLFDESHRVKSHKTKRFRMLRTMLRNVPRVIMMTGTPLGNTLQDLWSQYFLLDRGQRLFRSFTPFREFYFEKKDYMGFHWEPRPQADKAIALKVVDITFQIHPDDVTLPPVHRGVIEVRLPPSMQREYKKFEKDFFTEITDDQIEAFNIATLLGKLRQFASGFLYTDEDGNYKVIHTAKLDALRDYLHEVGEPTMVIGQFRAEFDQLAKRYPGLHIINGSVKKRAMKKATAAWNNKEIDMLAMYPTEGLNLQHGGRRQIWLSPDWSYLRSRQTIGRLVRVGQEKEVYVDFIVAKDTVDEMIMKAVKKKALTDSEFQGLIKNYRKRIMKR